VLAPLPSPIKAKKEGTHRVILVVVSVFSPIIVVILAVVLIGCLLGNRNEVEDVGNAGQGTEILGAANLNGVETVVHVDDNGKILPCSVHRCPALSAAISSIDYWPLISAIESCNRRTE
jgi:hypothetical protein